MSAAKVKAAVVLLIVAVALGACDRSLPDRSPVSDPDSFRLRAADAACALPLERFAPSLRPLVGSRLDHPHDRVLVDREGRILWNGEAVEPQRLSQYIDKAAAAEPPIFLVVTPDREAPCAIVRETLVAAIGAGRCSPERCAFEWPSANAPPLLPEGPKLLGDWILVSIDDAAPPPHAPPIEVTFTDGAVSAQSQCVTYRWLIGEEDGRLRLKTPPGPVAMCARATSPWEDRFGAAMAAASYVESSSEGLIVTGPKGRLKLKRPN
jgi:hypothetical protein